MLVDLILTHERINPQEVRNKICVVIDTLRATSTIITALGSGCPEVIPVSSVANALELKKNTAYSHYLLGGEIEGEHISNFHKGNSPLEYQNGALKGTGLILTTTNGTRTLEKVRLADQVLVCALLNGHVVINYLAKQNKDTVICCSGRRGGYSLEDFLTAGRVVRGMAQQKTDLQVTDLAFTAACFYEYIRSKDSSLKKVLKDTANGKRLENAGQGADVDYCSQEDVLSVLPFYKDGLVRC